MVREEGSMKRLRLFTLLLFGLSLLLVACSFSDDEDLEDTEWELQTLGGMSILPDTSAILNFEGEDQLFGSATCNRIIGTWKTGDDNALTIVVGPMTRMACPGDAGDQETAFLEALDNTASFEVNGDTLTLLDAGGLELATLVELEEADLEDTNWQLVYLNDGQQGVMTVLDGTTITALFDDDEDTLSGNDGCNTFTAGFDADDGDISIDTVASTAMACEEPIMDQEQAFLAALERAETYELGSNSLALRTADGELLAYFRIAE
jgi:heat shock protein HslJ